MSRSGGNRKLRAVRRAVPVLAVLVVALLSALPLYAQLSAANASFTQTWTLGIPATAGGSSVYPQCVVVASDLMLVTTPFTTVAGKYPVGVYPNSMVGIYTSCTWNVAGGYMQSMTPETVPAGWLAISRVLYYYGSSNTWSVCAADGVWIYNPSSMPTMTIQSPGTSSAPYSQAPYTPQGAGTLGPCGPGYYDLYTGAYAWTGSSWLGGWILSGYLHTN